LAKLVTIIEEIHNFSRLIPLETGKRKIFVEVLRRVGKRQKVHVYCLHGQPLKWTVRRKAIKQAEWPRGRNLVVRQYRELDRETEWLSLGQWVSWPGQKKQFGLQWTQAMMESEREIFSLLEYLQHMVV